MEERKGTLVSFSYFVHAQFLWFLLGSYVVAAVFPAVGLWIRSVAFTEIDLFREQTKISLPMLMLAFLLLNAGLGVQTSQLRNLLQRPLVLIVGLLANLVIPIAFIFFVSQTMRLWHNPDEVQNILVGLALVASMPIAGSSTAWSQNANGDLALSLGLVLLSTVLSPMTTPLALHSVGFLTTGDYAEDLHELATSGTAGFLVISIVLPCAFGIAGQGILRRARMPSAKPALKLLNLANLLLLNYANASVSLPQAVADPDWDFLTVIFLIVVSLCTTAFVSGLWIAQLLQAKPAQRTSLMFGLGMNNNGTGLVLASMALADHPRVLLPIILYNLVQHLVAGGADFLLFRLGPHGTSPTLETKPLT